MPRNTENPMKTPAGESRPRCGAHARSTGEPCRRFPLKGKTRCRLHGGASSGRPPTSGLYTKAYQRLKERVGLLMWLVQGIHGLSKKHHRFRATPERVERLLKEAVAFNRNNP